MVQMPKRKKPEAPQQTLPEALAAAAHAHPDGVHGIVVVLDTHHRVHVHGVNTPTVKDILGLLELAKMQVFTSNMMPLVPPYLAQVHEQSRRERISAPLVAPNGVPIQSVPHSESGAPGPS